MSGRQPFEPCNVPCLGTSELRKLWEPLPFLPSEPPLPFPWPCVWDTCHILPSGPSDCGSSTLISLMLAVPSAVVLRSATLTKDRMSDFDHPLYTHVFGMLARPCTQILHSSATDSSQPDVKNPQKTSCSTWSSANSDSSLKTETHAYESDSLSPPVLSRFSSSSS